MTKLEQIEVDPARELYGWLTLQYGLERGRATIRWADMAIKQLEATERA